MEILKRNSLSKKIAAATIALVVITVGLVTLAVRQSVISQFKSQYADQVAASLHAVEDKLATEQSAISARLSEFGRQMRTDSDLRLHLGESEINSFVVDYASSYMATLGLQVLTLVDAGHQVVSSGHARNDFGSDMYWLVRALRESAGRPVLAHLTNSGENLVVLARMDSLVLHRRPFYLVGGKKIDRKLLTSFTDIKGQFCLLKLPGLAIAPESAEAGALLKNLQATKSVQLWQYEISEEYTLGQIHIALNTPAGTDDATLFLLHPKTNLNQLLRRMNRSVLFISSAGIILAVLLSLWLGRSVSKPLRSLATAAKNLKLNTLEADFDVDTNDEVGTLNEALNDMLTRLRVNRVHLAAAEKKASFAEIARQVNHDIKNGFIPIRNIMQHWQEVAQDNKENLARVFEERKATVLDSLSYLEGLARDYSRLRPQSKQTSVNVNEIVANLVRSYTGVGNGALHIEFHPQAEASVLADAVQLRRAFENLLQNAIEAITGKGSILIKTSLQEKFLLLTVSDTGSGIPPDVRSRLFEAHFTTKSQGTGLGLVNVKRIIEEAGGTISIDSQVSKGTTVSVTLPVSASRQSKTDGTD